MLKRCGARNLDGTGRFGVWKSVGGVRAREDTERSRKGSRARDGARGVWEEVRALNHDVEVSGSTHQSERLKFEANRTDIE